MKTMIKLMVLLSAVLFATVSFARDTTSSYSIKNALSSKQAQKANVGTTVKL